MVQRAAISAALPRRRWGESKMPPPHLRQLRLRAETGWEFSPELGKKNDAFNLPQSQSRVDKGGMGRRRLSASQRACFERVTKSEDEI
jgi:hypothetical protein